MRGLDVDGYFIINKSLLDDHARAYMREHAWYDALRPYAYGYYILCFSDPARMCAYA